MTNTLRERAAASTEVATTEDREAAPSIATFITAMKPELQRALPKGLDADRMARLVLTVVRQNPKLAQCTQTSFAGAMLTAAAYGLEVGTPEAYLTPYEFHKGARSGEIECQLVIGYQGYSKLFWQSPLAQHLDAQTVYENDFFDYEKGLTPFLRHKPARGDRGKVIYYYAVVKLNNGGSHFDVFTPEEIRELRRGKVGTSGDIPDPQRWMERKTALKQVLKTMPKSTVLAAALKADEEPGSSLYAERVEDRQAVTTATQATPQVTTGPAAAASDHAAPDAAYEPDEDPWAEQPMEDRQRRAIFAAFGQLKKITGDPLWDNDEAQRAYMTDALEREVKSRGDLTWGEASVVLQRLREEVTKMQAMS